LAIERLEESTVLVPPPVDEIEVERLGARVGHDPAQPVQERTQDSAAPGVTSTLGIVSLDLRNDDLAPLTEQAAKALNAHGTPPGWARRSPAGSHAACGRTRPGPRRPRGIAARPEGCST